MGHKNNFFRLKFKENEVFNHKKLNFTLNSLLIATQPMKTAELNKNWGAKKISNLIQMTHFHCT